MDRSVVVRNLLELLSSVSGPGQCLYCVARLIIKNKLHSVIILLLFFTNLLIFLFLSNLSSKNIQRHKSYYKLLGPTSFCHKIADSNTIWEEVWSLRLIEYLSTVPAVLLSDESWSLLVRWYSTIDCLQVVQWTDAVSRPRMIFLSAAQMIFIQSGCKLEREEWGLLFIVLPPVRKFQKPIRTVINICSFTLRWLFWKYLEYLRWGQTVVGGLVIPSH